MGLLICVIFSTFLFCDQSRSHPLVLSDFPSVCRCRGSPSWQSQSTCPTKAPCLQKASSRDSPVSSFLCFTFSLLAVTSPLFRTEKREKRWRLVGGGWKSVSQGTIPLSGMTQQENIPTPCSTSPARPPSQHSWVISERCSGVSRMFKHVEYSQGSYRSVCPPLVQ